MDDARDGKGMRERMSRTREARSQLGRAGRHELQAGRCTTTTTTPTRTQTYLEFLKGGGRWRRGQGWRWGGRVHRAPNRKGGAWETVIAQRSKSEDVCECERRTRGELFAR